MVITSLFTNTFSAYVIHPSGTWLVLFSVRYTACWWLTLNSFATAFICKFTFNSEPTFLTSLNFGTNIAFTNSSFSTICLPDGQLKTPSLHLFVSHSHPYCGQHSPTLVCTFLSKFSQTVLSCSHESISHKHLTSRSLGQHSGTPTLGLFNPVSINL